ncbi:MAG: hypothetical protein HEP71_14945 [Roseivirga sp.]|nr:hypothetical protein [Roseivirga sp.]
MRYLFTLLFTLTLLQTMAQSPEITFSTKKGTDREKEVIPKVQEILNKYDLTKWVFTDKIIIEAFAIPHSHPVLTLNTKPQSQDELLSTFLHEQIHWYVDENKSSEQKAIAEFKKKYKNVPFGNREGAKDEYSTYLHLIVCYLEFKSMVDLVGEERAEKVMRDTNHYTWIYETVLKDRKSIGKTLAKNKLNLVD